MDSTVDARADVLSENRRCIVAYLDTVTYVVVNGLFSSCSPLDEE